MRRHCATVALEGALVAASAMIYFNGTAAAEQYTRTVSPGRTAQLIVYKAWDPVHCGSMFAVAKLAVPPQHGKMSHHTTPATIPVSRFGGRDHCYGQPTTGFAIMYTSSPGYRGTDSFTLNVDWPAITRHSVDTFAIIVQ